MASFIIENMEEIVAEWESFARNLSPETAKMDSWALRDHAKPMLEAIAKDIETSQTARQKDRKSKGLGPVFTGVETAAAAHGLLRQADGFDMPELVAEFRALRATVLRLWIAHDGYGDPDSAYEMARFNEAIDQALGESVVSYSRELDKSRDIFLAILGHDLRSPLSALAGASSILSGPVSDAHRDKALATVTNSVAVMSAMFCDLLEFTRTRLGKGIPVTPSNANLESVCKAVINEVSHAYPKTAFRFESAGMLDGRFDSARIHQAVANLVNNAVHHGKQGSPVFLGVNGDDHALRLQVKNQGVPIAPNLLQTIFDPLVQIPAKGTDPRPSTNVGLGLFIAREIIVAHGGTILASSSAEAGTTFTVELPRDVARHPRAQAAPVPLIANTGRDPGWPGASLPDRGVDR